MKRTIGVLALAFSVLVASPAVAGKGKGGRSGSGQPADPSPGVEGQGGQRAGSSERGASRQERIQASSKQRHQYQTCTQSTVRARKEARNMVRQAGKSRFDAGNAREHAGRLGEAVGSMNRDIDRFKGDLDEAQRTALRDRIRDLDRTRERVNAGLKSMQRELDRPDPEQARVETQAREVQRTMKEFRKRYRSLGSQMDVNA